MNAHFFCTHNFSSRKSVIWSLTGFDTLVAMASFYYLRTDVYYNTIDLLLHILQLLPSDLTHSIILLIILKCESAFTHYRNQIRNTSSCVCVCKCARARIEKKIILGRSIYWRFNKLTFSERHTTIEKETRTIKNMYERIVKCILKSLYHVLYNTKCIHCVDNNNKE